MVPCQLSIWRNANFPTKCVTDRLRADEMELYEVVLDVLLTSLMKVYKKRQRLYMASPLEGISDKRKVCCCHTLSLVPQMFLTGHSQRRRRPMRYVNELPRLYFNKVPAAAPWNHFINIYFLGRAQVLVD